MPAGRDWQLLLRKHGIRPSKKLSQNFLVDAASAQRVVAAAELTGEELVLEVGAGLGALTLHLARAARRVVAVELDRSLLPLLQEVLGFQAHVSVVQGDILELDLESLTEGRPYLVMGNIPYHITSALMRRLLETRLPPQRLVLTVQREVAERIVSLPGELSLLALSVQLYGNPRIVGNIAAGCFYPPPKVESSVLRVDVHPAPVVPRHLIALLFRLARAGFGQKRKQLANALSKGIGASKGETIAMLQAAGIVPHQRAQQLTLDDWRRLAEVMAVGEWSKDFQSTGDRSAGERR